MDETKNAPRAARWCEWYEDTMLLVRKHRSDREKVAQILDRIALTVRAYLRESVDFLESGETEGAEEVEAEMIRVCESFLGICAAAEWSVTAFLERYSKAMYLTNAEILADILLERSREHDC